MELKQQFEEAAAKSKTLPEKPDSETLLLLYSLYKQSTLWHVQQNWIPIRKGYWIWLAGSRLIFYFVRFFDRRYSHRQ